MYAVDDSLCNVRAFQPSKMQIQMDRLLRTSLYRALLKSLTRKAVSENRLRNYFHDFAQQATTICDDTDALSALRTLNYTQVQFRSLLRRVSERDTPPPHYLSRFINQAIEFICTETDLLYYRLNIHSVLSLSLHLSRRSIGLKNTMLSTCRRFFAVLT